MKRRSIRFFVLGTFALLSTLTITLSVALSQRTDINLNNNYTNTYQTTNLTVLVSNSVDGNNIRNTSIDNYGDSITVNAPTKEGYTFLYWVDVTKSNKVIGTNVSLTFFVTKDNIHIKAIYQDNASFELRFVDYNGYVISGGSKDANGPNWDITPPTQNTTIVRPGYEFKYWSFDGITEATLTNVPITGDLIIYAVYGLKTGLPSSIITVESGTGGKTATFGELVTVSPTIPSEQFFLHWSEGSRIISYDQNYTFTAYRDITLTANFVGSAPSDTPIVTLDDEYFVDSYNTNYQVTLVGRVELPNSYTLVETGILFLRGTLEGSLTLDTANVIKVESTNQNQYGEFSATDINIPFASTLHARAYYAYNTGSEVVIAYSSNTVIAGIYATDLFFSEYIEGGFNNKAIEIHNGTGSPIDLSIYKINLYSNASTTVSALYQLTGTLQHGDVFVIAHSLATAAFTSVADVMVNGGVVSFNGDDAVELVKNNVRIDLIGVVGSYITHPAGIDGQGLGAITGATQNKTLVRYITILGPSSTFVGNQWVVYAQDTSTYLGSHSANITTAAIPE